MHYCILPASMQGGVCAESREDAATTLASSGGSTVYYVKIWLIHRVIQGRFDPKTRVVQLVIRGHTKTWSTRDGHIPDLGIRFQTRDDQTVSALILPGGNDLDLSIGDPSHGIACVKIQANVREGWEHFDKILRKAEERIDKLFFP